MNLILQGVQEAVEMLVRLEPEVVKSAWLSIWVSSLAVALAALVGIPIGALLARVHFLGRGMVIALFRGAMAMPTVFVGVVCFAIFARQGILGPLQLLYSPWAIVIGEFILATPIVVSLTHAAISELDEVVFETAKTLGASKIFRLWTYLREVHIAIQLAILTAFARCFTELGIAMIVGGNIKHRTRTLSTATTIEISQGEFGKAFALGLILLVISVAISLVIGTLGRTKKPRERRK